MRGWRGSKTADGRRTTARSESLLESGVGEHGPVDLLGQTLVMTESWCAEQA